MHCNNQMLANPECDPTFLEDLERRICNDFAGEDKIEQKLATRRSVMSFSSLMTTLDQYSGHWDAFCVCIVVLTFVCELSKSEHNLELTTVLYINLKKCL